VPSPFPIFDSFFPGHSMTVWTEKGPVQGVLALPSTHILSRDARRNISEYFTIDNFYLDIGAASRLDAEASGVKFCDPVTVSQELQSLPGEKACGYGIGDRLSAAVLVDTIRRHSREEMSSGARIVWLAQTKFFMRGSRQPKAMGAVHSTKYISGREILVIDVFPESEESRIALGRGPVFIPGSGTGAMKQLIQNAAEKYSVSLQEASEVDSPVLNAFKEGYASSALCLPVRYVHTPSEIVDFSDFKGLAEILSAVLMKEGI